MKIVGIALIVGFSSLIAAVSASAATTLRTPFVTAAQGGYCFVSNVSAKPATVTVRLQDFAGATMTPSADTCSQAALAPGASCALGISPPGGDVPGFVCSIVSSTNKVRAIGYGYTGTDLVAVPATAK